MRCKVCGRVVRIDGKLTGKRNAKEIEFNLSCRGCPEDFHAALMAPTLPGQPPVTPDAAFEVAKNAHRAREAVVAAAIIKKRLAKATAAAPAKVDSPGVKWAKEMGL